MNIHQPLLISLMGRWSEFSAKQKLASIVIIALTVRFVCTVSLTHMGDSSAWPRIMASVESGNDIYGVMGNYYTPVWGYLLSFLDMMIQAVGAVPLFGDYFEGLLPLEGVRSYRPFVISPEMNMAIKFPLDVIDVAVGWMLYRIVLGRTGDMSRALRAMALWCFCPITIYMSSIQGQFDCISTALILGCIVLAGRNRPLLAGIVFGFAIWLKVFPAVCVLLLVAYLRSVRGREWAGGAVSAAVGALIVSAILILPQIANGQIDDAFVFLTDRQGTDFGSLYEAATSLRQILVGLLLLALMVLTARRIWHMDRDEAGRAVYLCAGLLIAVAVMLNRGYQYAPSAIGFIILCMEMAPDCRGYSASYWGLGLFSFAEAFVHAGFTLLCLSCAYYGLIDYDTFTSLSVSFAEDLPVHMIEGVLALMWSIAVWLFIVLAAYDMLGRRGTRSGMLIERLRAPLGRIPG